MVRITSLRRYSDNRYVFGTSWQVDSCGSSGMNTIPFTQPAIGVMDTLGNVLAYSNYSLEEGCRNALGDIVVTEDKGAIAWGSDTSFFALRVDSSLVGIWGKRISGHGGFQFIKELPGGDLLAGINMTPAGAVVARMNAAGDFLWVRSYIRPRGMVHDAVIESDDSFIVTGYTDSTASTNPFIPYPSAYHPKLFMMKLNGDGETIWCRGYDSAPHLWYSRQPSRIVRTLDGNFAVLATMGYPLNNFFYRNFLMKTDANGDTLWTRSVGASGFDYYAMDVMAHSDGGYLMSGYVWGDSPPISSAAFLFKSDSAGRFPCSDQAHVLNLIELFPSDSSFTLTSVDGMFEQSALMVDTIFPFAVYDACLVTSVPSYHTSKQRSVRVYPNPTPGRFNLEFSDPLLRDSYYSVFDATGRLLYQRPLPTGATLEEVDLSRFGRGAYVLRLTDPEGVRHERVVVE